MSSYNQLLLCAILGPLGVFYSSPLISIVLTIITAIAVIFSPANVLYIIAASFIVSIFASMFLVSRHNRLLAKNFEPSSFLGGVSCKVIRRETSDKEYHLKLRKVRRKKRAIRHVVFCFAVLGIAGCGLVLHPDFRYTLQSSYMFGISSPENSTVILTDPSSVSGEYAEQKTPSWIRAEQEDSVSSSLRALEYQDSSDGYYRPEIELSCGNRARAVSFIASEVLGTESASIIMKSDDNQKLELQWTISDDFTVATVSKPDEAVRLIRAAKELSVVYKPFGSEHEKVATFDLRNSTEELDALAGRCNVIAQSAFAEQ